MPTFPRMSGTGAKYCLRPDPNNSCSGVVREKKAGTTLPTGRLESIHHFERLLAGFAGYVLV